MAEFVCKADQAKAGFTPGGTTGKETGLYRVLPLSGQSPALLRNDPARV